MDRWWLLTWTTYGTWLPGDPRGSIASVRDQPGPRQENDKPGTPVEPPMPGLYKASALRLKGPPVRLNMDQAEVLLAQFQETAVFRGWVLDGTAIMANHVHLVVGVNGDPEPDSLMRDFKAYGSRVLNRRWERPASGTWWSSGGGSKRKLPHEAALAGARRYLRGQPYPLLVWLAAGGRIHQREPEGEPGALAPGGSSGEG